jgi:hypothetical protein
MERQERVQEILEEFLQFLPLELTANRIQIFAGLLRVYALLSRAT